MSWIRTTMVGAVLAALPLWACSGSTCGERGACTAGEPCSASGECVDRLCAPLSPGASSVCLAPCSASEPCPTGQICNVIGTGSFCEAAMSSPDAGPDGSVAPDAGPTDADGDGVPAPTDCDDSSPTIGSTAERPCESMCGAGTEQCTSGVWGACSAPTDCACSTEGATRAAACGNCGNEMQTCTSGRWTSTSDCLGQGCMPGAVETDRSPYCEERRRICTSLCSWSDWEVTIPAHGECAIGVCSGDGTGRICNEECMYEASTRC